MNARVTMALVCVAVALATTVFGQQAAAKPKGTNAVTVLSAETNIIAVVRGCETNFVLEVTEKRSDGGMTTKCSLLPHVAISRPKPARIIVHSALANSDSSNHEHLTAESEKILKELGELASGGAVIILRPLADGDLPTEDRNIGDFWLPGEFEKMLEEKRQQQRASDAKKERNQP